MGGDGHPYAPADLHLPGFVPLQLSQGQILAPYLGTSVFVVLAVWLVSGRCRGLSKTDRLLMCWWAFTGLTHIVIEGTFVFNPGFFSKENPNYFDEVWKEYSKGDSRYVARDPATVTVEGITAVLEGPASLLAVYAIASHKSYSHILQFTVCLGQLYGCLVYFITAYLDGFNFWVSPFYFWAYFIGANSFWVWIPTLIAMRSWKNICAAFRTWANEFLILKCVFLKTPIVVTSLENSFSLRSLIIRLFQLVFSAGTVFFFQSCFCSEANGAKRNAM